MWQFIKDYPKKYWKWYLSGFFSLIITTYVTTLIPLEIKAIIDAINQQQPWEILKYNVLMLICLAILLSVVRTCSRILIFTPGRYVEYDLRKNIHAHLLTLPPNFFREHTIGDMMSRIINDIQALRLLSAFGFLHIINTIMIYTLVVGQMIVIDPILTCWTLSPIPVALLSIRFFVKRMYTYIKQSQQQLGRITDFFVESVANISLIKTFTAETRIIDEMQKDNINYRNTQINLVFIRSIMFPFIASIGSFGGIILLYKGGQAILNGTITIGDFVAFSTYLAILAWPTAAFSWIINIIQRGISSLERINSILYADAHPQFYHKSDNQINTAPTISVKNLSFTFKGGQTPVLNNISFQISSGKCLGIFGPTGSGKTTLANLLSLIEPTKKNQIFFDDVDVTTKNVSELRHIIAMVPQRRFLFSDTINHNIAFSRPHAIPENHIKSSAERACVKDDINQFPNQWETLVGEKGVILSGGQQHRLALARGYASNYNVLILDDVLSSVDHSTEKQIIKELFSEVNPPTTIIISHRISALQQCDHIIVLDQGSITDQGTHQELISHKGPYQATWNYQKLEAE